MTLTLYFFNKTTSVVWHFIASTTNFFFLELIYQCYRVFKTNPLVSMALTLVFNLTFLAASLSTTLLSFGFSIPT